MNDALLQLFKQAADSLGGGAVRANVMPSGVKYVRAEVLMRRPEAEPEEDVPRIKYSFQPSVKADGSGIDITKGSVSLGSNTRIPIVASSPQVSSSATHVWLKINVKELTAAMLTGTEEEMDAALSEEDAMLYVIYPLVETVWENEICVDAIRLLDAFVPRASG